MAGEREWLKHPYEVEGESPWPDRPYKKLGFPVETPYGTVYIAPLAADRLRLEAASDGYRIKIPLQDGVEHDFAVSALYVHQPEGVWLETESGLHATSDTPVRRGGDYFEQRRLAPGREQKLRDELRQYVGAWVDAHPEQMIAAEKVELNNNAYRLEQQIAEKTAELAELTADLAVIRQAEAKLTLESVEHGRGLSEEELGEGPARPVLDDGQTL